MSFVPGRRRLLAAAVQAGAFSTIHWMPRANAAPVNRPRAPGMYLSVDELAWVEAAIARLIPRDALGPGALECGVATFIDHQLASPYGRAETWYMQGPWKEGTPEQGYQLKQTPAQLYRTAIADVDAYCVRTQRGQAFAALDGATQDHVLEGLEKGTIELARVPAKAFFKMLLDNTVEGFLADPMYFGNRNFAGWNLIGFPGPRYNYVNEIEQYGKRYQMPTIGLLGRDGTRRMET